MKSKIEMMVEQGRITKNEDALLRALIGFNMADSETAVEESVIMFCEALRRVIADQKE